MLFESGSAIDAILTNPQQRHQIRVDVIDQVTKLGHCAACFRRLSFCVTGHGAALPLREKQSPTP